MERAIWHPDFDYSHLQPEQEKYGIIHGIGGDTHFTPDYQIGLKLGWGGLLEKVRHFRSLHGPEKSAFYQAEEDTVLDGWSGYGFLRSHAYYYFFLHPEMRAMLSEKERSDDLIESLEEQPAKVVIYDSSVKALPKKVQKHIRANYKSSGQGNIWLRNN